MDHDELLAAARNFLAGEDMKRMSFSSLGFTETIEAIRPVLRDILLEACGEVPEAAVILIDRLMGLSRYLRGPQDVDRGAFIVAVLLYLVAEEASRLVLGRTGDAS